ncbi:MAG: GumC family protein [Candidatus Binatia bacterium]
MAQDIMPKLPKDIGPAGSFYPIQPPGETRGQGAMEQFFYVVFKWRRLIIGLFLVFTVAAGVAVYLKPPVRRAVAKIMLKGGRVPLQISGLASRSSKFLRSSEVIQSEIELIKSREVLLPVAKKLLLRDRNGGKKIGQNEVEAMVRSLTRNTVPVAIPGTNVIEVTYFAQTSDDAKTNLGLIIDQYLEEQAAIQSGSSKLLKFYQQEQERVRTKLVAAEDKLKKWMEENQTVSIDEHITGQLTMLADRENALQQTDTQIEMTRTNIAMLRKQLSSQPERLVTSRARVRNPLVTKLKSDLVTVEVSLQDLLQRYTVKDRRVQERKEQIALLKEKLAAAEKEETIGSETTALNPLRETLKKELAAAEALLSSLASRKETLRRQIRDAQPALGALREKKIEINRMARVVDLLKDAFILYGKKFEEAKIAAGLGKEQLANVALIEKAYAKPGTDLMKRIGMLLVAAFVGLALGMAIAFGFEFFNDSFRTQEDLEHYLGLRVLASIPDLRHRPLALEG